MIDFIGAPYEVNENDGDARVTVGVVSGQLMREVVVELAFSDGTAISKYTAKFLPHKLHLSTQILS